MRVRRASTSCVTSRTIFDLSFGLRVVNHFERRCVVEVNGGCHKHVSGRKRTNHFALAREENQISGEAQLAMPYAFESWTNLIAIFAELSFQSRLQLCGELRSSRSQVYTWHGVVCGTRDVCMS